jgi:hypothetical protein
MSPINVALVLVWVVAIALSLAVRPTDCASIRGTWGRNVAERLPKNEDRTLSKPGSNAHHQGRVPRFYVDRGSAAERSLSGRRGSVGGGRVWSTDTHATADGALARAKLKVDGQVFGSTW